MSGKIEGVHVAVPYMIVATIASIVLFILSVTALEGIYGWYPEFVAQQWFIYDQLLTVFSFLEVASGASATVLIVSGKNLVGATALAIVCTVSGAGVFVVSLIQPLAVLWQSLLYYLFPFFACPLTGTVLTILRKDIGNKPKTEKDRKDS